MCERAPPLVLPAVDALRWPGMRAGSAPRAPRWVGVPPPRPPAFDACRTINAPVHASVMPKHVLCCCLLHFARKHVRQALGKRMPLAGGAGGQAAPCRPPRRAAASIQSKKRGSQERSPGPWAQRAQRAPKPPASDDNSGSMHRFMPPLCRANRVIHHGTAQRRHARRSLSMRSHQIGVPRGECPWRGCRGLAPGRSPRRRTESLSNWASQGQHPGPEAQPYRATAGMVAQAA
jgi:hypothetical protein